MKHIALLFVFVAIVFLTGCDIFPEWRQSIKDQASQTIDGVKRSAEDINSQFQQTRQSVETKIDEVQSALREVREAGQQVGEAIDAVQRVTGGNLSQTASSTVVATSTENVSPPSLEGASMQTGTN